MKKVLVANSQAKDARMIEKYLARHFEVVVISRPALLRFHKGRFDLMLIDHNFTANSGIDFLMDILPEHPGPILMFTPASDPQCAIEALRAGAFNYIVKTGAYLQFLNVAVDDALMKYQERQGLKETITALKERIDELTQKTRVKKPLHDAPPSSVVPGTFLRPPPRVKTPASYDGKKELNLMKEVIARFKKGDVNVPTLVEIVGKFNELVTQ
jgi:DNA-binding NtrC family response regulator